MVELLSAFQMLDVDHVIEVMSLFYIFLSNVNVFTYVEDHSIWFSFCQFCEMTNY